MNMRASALPSRISRQLDVGRPFSRRAHAQAPAESRSHACCSSSTRHTYGRRSGKRPRSSRHSRCTRRTAVGKRARAAASRTAAAGRASARACEPAVRPCALKGREARAGGQCECTHRRPRACAGGQARQRALGQHNALVCEHADFRARTRASSEAARDDWHRARSMSSIFRPALF